MLKLATKFAPIASGLENAYEAGFRHAELFLDRALLADWRSAAYLARSYPHRYVLHFPNELNLSMEILQAAVDLYRELDCRCLVIHQPMFDKFHEVLVRLNPNVRLAVENHKLAPDGLARWAERNPGLTLDVEHLWKFTLANAPLAKLLPEVGGFLEKFGHKLRHVHLPGYWPGFDEHRPMYCSREMIFPVLSLLERFDFDGFVVSEVEPIYQNPAELRMDVLLFDAWRATNDSHRPG